MFFVHEMTGIGRHIYFFKGENVNSVCFICVSVSACKCSRLFINVPFGLFASSDIYLNG